jgi:hypothetical protein
VVPQGLDDFIFFLIHPLCFDRNLSTLYSTPDGHPPSCLDCTRVSRANIT